MTRSRVRLFVTGTDTGVGKTRATACLAAAARDAGSRVVAAKPIASGVPRGEPGEDASALGAAAGHPPRWYEAFELPVSPHRAARAEGRELDVDALLAWVRALDGDLVLVEGAGGWRVPLRLAPRCDTADLARATGSRVLVVAADRLGVLNHTLLTVEAVRRDGLEVVGVVLNQGVPGGDPYDPSRASNLDDLRQLLDAPVVALGPVGPEPGAAAEAGRALWAGLARVSGRP